MSLLHRADLEHVELLLERPLFVGRAPEFSTQVDLKLLMV